MLQNFTRILQRSARTVIWIIIVLSFILPLCLLGYIVHKSFSPPIVSLHEDVLSTTNANSQCHLSWKEPFEYEAKVYASLQSDAFNNTAFFESAQLLWHIKPTSLKNRYPKQQKYVSVDIPSHLRFNKSRSLSLYAHIFIQKAGHLSPHPNITDPFLIHSAVKVVYWRPISLESDRMNSDFDSAYKEKEHELVATTEIPWAVALENHIYSMDSTPNYVSKVVALTDSDGSTRYVYNPPLHLNTFTKSAHKSHQLVLCRPEDSSVQFGRSKIDVNMEFQGFRHGWFVMAAALQNFTISTTDFSFDYSRSASAQSTLTQDQQMIKLDESLPFMRSSLLSLGAAAICLLLCLPCFLLYLRSLVSFWCGPSSKWIGVSRTYQIIGSSKALLNCVYIWISGGTPWVPCLSLICFTYVLLKMFDVPACVKLGSRRIMQTIGLNKAASATNTVELNLDASESLEYAEMLSLNDTVFRSIRTRPEKLIVAARTKTDREALQYPRILFLLAVFFIALLSFAYNGSNLWSGEYIRTVIAFHIIALDWVYILPQVIVNYRAKSGSLIPPAISIYYTYNS